MEKETALVINKMTSMDHNPLEYDELVDAWNTLCEQSWVEDPADFQFADIEKAAIAVLSEESGTERTGNIGNEISRLLSTFEYPTFLVTSDGSVAAINSAASNEFEINIGEKIDRLPYSLETAQTISSMVSKSLRSERNEPSEILLKRACSKGNVREATIAVTTSLGRVPAALVFIITTKWKITSAELLKRHFRLTESETSVLESFVDGYSSQDIAKIRKRSHATVRTQFQSILAKTGAKNQTELLRLSLSLSNFSESIGIVADAVKHPHRRRAEMIREGGRLVELTIMGDYSGQPFLTFANASNYRFNAQVEQQLYDAGLFLISICGPGCGRTDPVPDWESRLNCMSEDAGAMLDQLNIDRCPILAIANNTPVCYAVAKRLPDRISHFVQIAACTPHTYLHTVLPESSWVAGIVKAGVSHPSMKRMLFRGGMRAFTTIGTKQFMRLQLSADCIEREHVFRPENMVEFEYALKVATEDGIAAASEDLALGFEDWTADVKSLSIGITVLHGKQDTLFPIQGTRNFAAAFPDKVTIKELDGAGFTLIQSHPAEAVGLLRTVADTNH